MNCVSKNFSVDNLFKMLESVNLVVENFLSDYHMLSCLKTISKPRVESSQVDLSTFTQ